LYSLNQTVVNLENVTDIHLYIGSNDIFLGVVVAEKKEHLWVGVDELVRVGDRGGATGPL